MAGAIALETGVISSCPRLPLLPSPENIDKENEINIHFDKQNNAIDIENTNNACSTGVIKTKDIYSNDIGQWPKKLNECFINYWVSMGSEECQHENADFTQTGLTIDNEYCVCKKHFFYINTSQNKGKDKENMVMLF